MRTFNYSAIREQKWDSEVLGLIAAIYKEAGKQELYLKQRPKELEKLVEVAKVQSTEASNAIEGHRNHKHPYPAACGGKKRRPEIGMNKKSQVIEMRCTLSTKTSMPSPSPKTTSCSSTRSYTAT